MWQRSKPYLMIAPATILMLSLFVGGIGNGLLQSVGLLSLDNLSTFSLEAYQRLLTREDFLSSFWLTLRIAFLSTVMAGVIGLGITLLLVYLQRNQLFKQTIWQRLIQLPLTIPHFVGAYFIVVLLMQSGWLARLCYFVGWIDDPKQFPVLVNDLQGWGIIFTYVWKETPFVVLMLYPVVTLIQKRFREVAKVYGAGKMSFFREITLPLILPAWLSAFLIIFAFSFSAFEVPFLLGVTFPEMLPVLSYELYTHGEWSDRPEALAIDVILALLTAIFGWLAYRFGRKYKVDRWEKGG